MSTVGCSGTVVQYISVQVTLSDSVHHPLASFEAFTSAPGSSSGHHIEGIIEIIAEVGALVLYFPPYSPDYNPIKEPFQTVKQVKSNGYGS